MSTNLSKYIPNHKAVEMIGNALGINGSDFLCDNRRNRHEYVIQFKRIRRRVFYHPKDIEKYIMKYGEKHRRLVTPLHKDIRLEIDQGWGVKADLFDKKLPVVGFSGLPYAGYMTAVEALRLAKKLESSAEEAFKMAS